MQSEWAPSKWARMLSRSPDWALSRHGLRLTLKVDGSSHTADVVTSSALQVSDGLLWSTIVLTPEGSKPVKVSGLSKQGAASLRTSFAEILEEIRIREESDALSQAHRAMTDWLTKRQEIEARADAERRWLTQEMLHSLESERPDLNAFKIAMLLRDPTLRARLSDKAVELDRDLRSWMSDVGEVWRGLNSRHSERELIECANILDRVESKPLTPEQAQAVVCFDNRVQVVASAGSGKTSTMVGRAAYAMHRGIAKPDEIIMLAFNKQAAEELKERANRSFQRLGMDGGSVEASTFHKLGLAIIGRATGRKPDIPEWAFEPVEGFRKLAELIDGLKDRSMAFRAQWDLFRFVCTRDLPKFGEAARPDAWDEQGNGCVLTADGTRVRSQEEALISNWLFYNGVNYRYEQPYVHDTADASHRQYKPDFYYPDIDLYHEHFALDARGNAPAHFGDYVAGVEWKRQLHAERGTALIETTSHQVRTGTVLDHLERELTERGIALDPNPDRPIPENGLRPMPSEELIGLVRTFISHYKSNGLTPDELAERVDKLPADAFKHRYRMFASLAVQIIKVWDEALAAVGGIDFEDMLNMAAEYVENGTVEEPYQVVMADEFQDASRARARLCCD